MSTVLITGGSKGIGKATADLLRSRGWKALVPSHDECDVTDIISLQSYVQRLQRTKMIRHIDALILNAHIWYAKPLHAQMWGDFLEQQNYVIGHWYLMREILKHSDTLQCVIGVSSMRGLIGGVETAPYSMAKASLIALMQGFAREYQGVRFNAICPGWTDTPMGIIVKATGGVSNPNAVAQPPDVIADAIAYLLDVNSTTNGITLKVNGGRTEKFAWKEV
jgi:NAD(P)-dependent dehydrogenase (short-subunit alcohol dehydrogenase family)